MSNSLPTPAEQATLTLWDIVNMSLRAYAKLLVAFHTPEQALAQPLSAWRQLNLHASHLERFGEYIGKQRQSAFLDSTLTHILRGDYGIIVYDDPRYPPTLKQIFDPPPILFFKGNAQALSMPQLAIVGTRKPSPHASITAFNIAQYLAHEGIWVTSGLAEGIDKQAHLGALSQSDPSKQGRTVAVLGTGIRQCYPKKHEPIVQQIIHTGGCVITELLPDNPPNKQGFPRRNRLVAGLSLATLVVEAALESGSLITANQTNEQGKQVFAIPSHIENEQARGCHRLIREGATLIDHPAQILEDLAVLKSPTAHHKPMPSVADSPTKPLADDMAKTFTPHTHAHPEPSDTLHSLAVQHPTTLSTFNPFPLTGQAFDVGMDSKTDTGTDSIPATSTLPEHLFSLYNQLDWVGQDVDNLVIKSGLNVATLMGQLMELELLGKTMQHGGLYMKCRS